MATSPKTILLTGSTDGIGLATATRLAALGHHLLLHGRDRAKVAHTQRAVRATNGGGAVSTFVADLSRLSDVEALAAAVKEGHPHLDVLINNAGVFRTPEPVTSDGLDTRFVVNTISPYLLTRLLLPLLGPTDRVINLSSAAQAPVDLRALAGKETLSDGAAYAQSKLALTMWSRHLATTLERGPVMVAVNPGSLLATKMVKEGYGIDGNDIGIGADILVRAAVGTDFAEASGTYYDNDAGRFAAPHPDALDPELNLALTDQIDAIIATHVQNATPPS
ncbi:oxidoreductase [Aeromicrobium sp. A1-2]|uniref:SDR family NAD(P)-dependent oxidoreductase n=1 Tax=Aeromicrobium sp. A1-2 TaxID=2107713 RepID=UPI000E4CB1C4|nr:SDR family NAD(P)-dependent oxidoreductase [Aeromicrobium sp. A1-2]AXT85754.1 oxidoreductase [Aeromicrobium sp. A1-2]